MGCLQLIMAVSVHIGYWGSYYSLNPDLRCTTQNTIAGAYYNSGGASVFMLPVKLRWEMAVSKLDFPAVTVMKRYQCCDIEKEISLLCLLIRARKRKKFMDYFWGGNFENM